jgi:hypothetical protein
MEMAAWISENLPQGSTVLAENRVWLRKPSTWSKTELRPDLKVSEEMFAPDFAPYDQLASRGTRYVAVIRTGFGGYLSQKRKASKNLEQQHQRRSSFYQQLFANATLLKKTGGYGGYLNQEIRLYELPKD